MTPFELDVLLWYFCHAGDHPKMRENPPVWRLTIDKFLAETLLEDCSSVPGVLVTYRLAERGHVYVHALMSVPLPVQRWIMPDQVPA